MRHHGLGRRLRPGRAAAHRGKGRRGAAGRLVGQTGMGAHRGKDLGVAAAEDHRHRRPRRQAGDKHPARRHLVAVAQLARHPGKDRRLAAVAGLILGREPVPAGLQIGGAGLLRVEHQQPLFLGQPVHPGALGEIHRRLGAAMQHHDQAARHAGAAGHIEPVGAFARRAGKAAGLEARALGQLGLFRGRHLQPVHRHPRRQFRQCLTEAAARRRRLGLAAGMARLGHRGRLQRRGAERAAQRLGGGGKLAVAKQLRRPAHRRGESHFHPVILLKGSLLILCRRNGFFLPPLPGRLAPRPEREPPAAPSGSALAAVFAPGAPSPGLHPAHRYVDGRRYCKAAARAPPVAATRRPRPAAGGSIRGRSRLAVANHRLPRPREARTDCA